MDAVYSGESLQYKSKIRITITIRIYRYQQNCHAPPPNPHFESSLMWLTFNKIQSHPNVLSAWSMRICDSVPPPVIGSLWVSRLQVIFLRRQSGRATMSCGFGVLLSFRRFRRRNYAQASRPYSSKRSPHCRCALFACPNSWFKSLTRVKDKAVAARLWLKRAPEGHGPTRSNPGAAMLSPRTGRHNMSEGRLIWGRGTNHSPRPDWKLFCLLGWKCFFLIRCVEDFATRRFFSKFSHLWRCENPFV